MLLIQWLWQQRCLTGIHGGTNILSAFEKSGSCEYITSGHVELGNFQAFLIPGSRPHCHWRSLQSGSLHVRRGPSTVCVLLYIQTSRDASDCSDLNHLKRSMTRKGTDLFMWPAENLTFLVVLFYRCSFILIFIILNSHNNNNNKALQ